MSGFEVKSEVSLPQEYIYANQGIHYVNSAADLPDLTLAPDGNMRSKLENNMKYIVTSTFEWPLIWIPSTSGPSTNFTEIAANTLSALMLFNGSDTPQFWGRNVGTLSFMNCVIVDSGNSGAGKSTVFLDIVGTGQDFSFCAFNICSVALMKSFGRVVNSSTQLVQCRLANLDSGIVIRNDPGKVGSHLFSNVIFTEGPTDPAVKKPLVVVEGEPSRFEIEHGDINLNSGDPFLCIEESSGGIFNLMANGYSGPSTGDFFLPDQVYSLTGMSNEDINITSFSDSTLNPGVDTTAYVSGYTGLVVGQEILIADAGAPYDGTHVITNVAADELSFDFATVFTSSTTGNIKITRITTSVPNYIVSDQTVTITGTTSYNGTFKALFTDNSTFDIPAVFVVNDATGSCTIISKNESFPKISALANGSQKNSKSIGGCVGVDNLATTVISTQNEWVDLNMNSSVSASSNIELWELNNTTTGELKYIGDTPFFGAATANISARSSGSAQNFQFRFVKNGAALPDGALSEKSLSSGVDASSLSVPINDAQENDLFRLQVRNVDGTSDVVVEQLIITIQ